MRNIRFESKTTPIPRWKSLRFFGILFCLIVLTAVFAGAAGASGIDITLGTPASGDNWAYDSENMTLTLGGGTWDYINVTGTGDLIVVLNGVNNITGGVVVQNNEYQEFYSIYVMDGNLTIQNGTGGGTLNVTAGASQQYAAGIYAEGDIIIKSGAVEVNISGNGDVWGIYADEDIEILGGQLDIKATASGDSAEANGICADEIKILGGLVNIEVTVSGDYAQANGIHADDAYIEISSGLVNIEAEASGDYAQANGIYADDAYIEISSRLVNIEAEASGDYAQASGIYVYDTYLEISSELVNIKAEALTNNAQANGIYADEIYIDDTYIEISGGTVKIDVTSETDYTFAFGIRAQSLIISGGDVKADVTSDSGVAEGMRVYDYLTISDGSVDIDVNSGGIFGYGIHVYDYLTISDGLVDVDVNSGGIFGYGIYASDLTVSGGVLNVAVESESGEVNGIYASESIIITGGEVEEVVNGVVFDLTPKVDNDRSSKDTGAGNYYSYPRTTENGGEVSFGTSRVISGVILPEGSSGVVVLKIDDTSHWPEDKETPFTFDISVENMGEGAAYISFRIFEEKLTALELTPSDIAVYHGDSIDWVKLTTTYEIKDSIIYYTAETLSFSQFKLTVEEAGSSPASTEDSVEPEIIEPAVTDEPQEIIPPIEPPVKDEEPESPMPFLAVLAGFGSAVLLRRR